MIHPTMEDSCIGEIATGPAFTGSPVQSKVSLRKPSPHFPGWAAPGAPGNLGRGRYPQEKAKLKAAAWISFQRCGNKAPQMSGFKT